MDTVSPDHLAAALELARHGCAVFPLGEGRKTPAIPKERGGRGCLDAITDAARIERWWRAHPRHNIGIATGTMSGVDALDVDPRHGGDAELVRLLGDRGGLPETWTALTPSGGLHHYWRRPPGIFIRCSASKVAPGIDVRGDGGYVAAPPSLHPLGARYAWASGRGPGEIEPACPPPWLLRLMTEAAPPVPPEGGSGEEPAADPLRVACAVRAIPNDAGVGWAEWNRVLMAIWGATGGTDDGRRIALNWSARYPAHDPDYFERRWAALRRCPPNRIGFGSLWHLATQADPDWEAPYDDYVERCAARIDAFDGETA